MSNSNKTQHPLIKKNLSNSSHENFNVNNLDLGNLTAYIVV